MYFSTDKEVWKDVEGYGGDYQVSSLGRVRSTDRIGYTGRKLKGTILKEKSNRGYSTVNLYLEGKQTAKLVSRLVAGAFVLNERNVPQVNHIDENKQNNKADNLEWVTPRENANHGTRLQKVMGNLQLTSEKQKTPVVMIDKETDEMVERFDSINDAFRWLGIVASGSISNVCKGKNKTAYGYKWRYSN